MSAPAETSSRPFAVSDCVHVIPLPRGGVEFTGVIESIDLASDLRHSYGPLYCIRRDQPVTTSPGPALTHFFAFASELRPESLDDAKHTAASDYADFEARR